MEVEIEQIFFHCGKAFLRSDVWNPQTWNPDVLPSQARLVKEVQATSESPEELEAYCGPEYLKQLYERR